jgi:hypothetical protein
MPSPTPPLPCGYCRRCLLHDDPGGCLVVEAWERENPVAAARAYAPWYRELLAERAEQAERAVSE